MSKQQSEHIAQTVNKERGKLFNFIKKRVRRTEDAEDILQDVFVQLVNVYDSIGSIERVASWLYKVANNKIIDAGRKKKSELVVDRNITSSEGEPLSLKDILPDFNNSPENIMFQEMIWESIQEALTLMPKEQRDVFIWHELEDLSFKEISQKTGLSENTLFSRKRYAIIYLRKYLKEIYNEL